MANRYGKYGTYNQTVGVRLDMDDAVHILTPTDVPLQQWLPTDTTNEVKVEWLEEDLMPQAVTIAGIPTGTGPWTITVADVTELRPNDVLHLRDGAAATQWLVDSINTGANTAVISGFAGAAVTPVDTNVLEIVGQYKVEGSDPEEARSLERTQKFNYTQIGQEAVKATRTAKARGARGGLYGMSDPYDHEVMKKFKELAIRFERSLCHGQRAISGSADKRFMGGLFYYITTNAESGVKANTKTLLNNLLRKCYDKGGSPTVLMVSPSVKQAISENVDPTLRRHPTTETRGGFVIERFLSDFGEVDISMNRHFPKTKGLALAREDLAKVTFDPYFHELLAKTGDSDQGEIVGEFSLRVKNEQAHGVLTITDA